MLNSGKSVGEGDAQRRRGFSAAGMSLEGTWNKNLGLLYSRKGLGGTWKKSLSGKGCSIPRGLNSKGPGRKRNRMGIICFLSFQIFYHFVDFFLPA